MGAIRRKVDIRKVKPGMVVARPVYGSEGQCLLKEGVEIKPDYINQLKNLRVNSIYIYDERMEGVVIEDVITEETRLEACCFVQELINYKKNNNNGKANGKIHHIESQMEKVVTKIIDELFSNKETMVNLVDIRTGDNYTFAHCVNVSVLGSLMAIKLGYSRGMIKHLTLGGMLHDLGKVRIPGSILKKAGYLNEKEYKLIQKHPEYGLDIFKENDSFTKIAGDIIVQHHERYDGSGYPLGLEGSRINPMAHIIAIVDVYDALTADRPYRKAYRPHEAIQMFTASGSSFNVDFLQTFLSFVAGYPLGTHVRLSNNESGLVVDNTPGYPLRPKVRVFYRGDELVPHPQPYEIDLVEKYDVVVTGVIEDEDPKYKN